MCTEMSRRNQTPAVTNFYRPQTKLWEGNVFTPVCDSVHGGGRGSLSRWGLFGGRGGSLSGRPPHGGRAGGTYPTGMHSCFGLLSSIRDCLLISKLFAISSRLLIVGINC